MTKPSDMFKELVAAGIIVYGGGNGRSPTSFSAGVTYSETFAKCYTGLQTIDSFDDLEDLYNKGKQAGWAGVIAWLAVKEGQLPLYWYVDQYQKDFDFTTLNLPPNSSDEYYKLKVANMDKEADKLLKEKLDLASAKYKKREEKRKQRITQTGIESYCSCCGQPKYENSQSIEHDYECMWYKEDNK